MVDKANKNVLGCTYVSYILSKSVKQGIILLAFDSIKTIWKLSITNNLSSINDISKRRGVRHCGIFLPNFSFEEEKYPCLRLQTGEISFRYRIN